ncbi:MAG: TROVE domain-containing protein, partial [Bacteroidales bacterium]|nr:TROVE domain-containing protein [Bacteroidales bacterium]
DKVMVYTDCQMWDSCYADAHIRKSWEKYKEMYPDAKLYLFDLSGYGQSPLRLEDGDVALIAGWSDKVFDIMAAIERGADAVAEINAISL